MRLSLLVTLLSLLALMPFSLIATNDANDFCKKGSEILKNAKQDATLDSTIYPSLVATYADCFVNGTGVKKDLSKAKKLLQQAADLGDRQSAYHLARMNLFESNDIREQKKGFEFFSNENDKGSKLAAGYLGFAYFAGRGTEKNLAKALELYELAARDGLTEWQYLLSHIYTMGYYGIKADYDKAQYWRNMQSPIQKPRFECVLARLYKEKISLPENAEIEKHYTGLCK